MRKPVTAAPDPAGLRALRAAAPADEDTHTLALRHGLPEGAFVAAGIGHGATAIRAHPDDVIPQLARLGELLAVTRAPGCRLERLGQYRNYNSGKHAQIVLDPAIDLRIFGQHWVHGFALEEALPGGGTRRSVQVFDAAGDPVHQVYLPEGADPAGFEALRDALALPEQDAAPQFGPRVPPAPARAEPANRDELLRRWAAMTDTHQFQGILKKCGMNRLGANRLAGAPWSVPKAAGSVQVALHLASVSEIPVMIFSGNMGCIQISSGVPQDIEDDGPWLRIRDAGARMDLRTDRLAEIWQVTKPTATGPAVSLEAFDGDGALVLQIFAWRRDRPGDAWNALVDALPRPAMEAAQ